LPTVLDILTKKFPEARKTTLRQMISDKRVWLGKNVVKSFNQIVNDGQTLTVRDHAKAKTTKDQLANWFEVIFEDEHLLVIDKPAGLITSSGMRDKRATAIGILVQHFESQRDADIGLIHRLDKDASGLLVFSKTAEAFDDLKRQFAQKSAGREYVAMVEKTQPIKPASGRMESRLVELADGKVIRTNNKHRGDHAVLDYELVEDRGKFAWMKVRLNTGRKHQIRVQLSSRGWPIVGDAFYHPQPNTAPRMMLHARRLELTHPDSGEPLVFEAPLPVEIQKWWEGQEKLAVKPVVKQSAPPQPKSTGAKQSSSGPKSLSAGLKNQSSGPKHKSPGPKPK
jgi:23S rRNA pseudouridine1911/1915/1917 synthase